MKPGIIISISHTLICHLPISNNVLSVYHQIYKKKYIFEACVSLHRYIHTHRPQYLKNLYNNTHTTNMYAIIEKKNAEHTSRERFAWLTFIERKYIGKKTVCSYNKYMGMDCAEKVRAMYYIHSPIRFGFSYRFSKWLTPMKRPSSQLLLFVIFVYLVFYLNIWFVLVFDSKRGRGYIKCNY
jgi:hypothetical protein